jgi:hypothetical protein
MPLTAAFWLTWWAALFMQGNTLIWLKSWLVWLIAWTVLAANFANIVSRETLDRFLSNISVSRETLMFYWAE